MGQLFDRKYSLRIVPQIGTGKKVTELRVNFRIEKTNEPCPNRSEISLYNCNSNTRGLLESKNTKIFLDAGYGTEIETIAIGNVTKVVHKYDSPDVISKIKIGDGDNAFRNARLEEGFPPGVSIRRIFERLIEVSGLGAGAQQGIPSTSYAQGCTLSGLIRDNLTDLCRKCDLEWSIQDESIQILPKTGYNLNNFVLLNEETGLIGSPSKTKKGIEFVSLLQPRLKPGTKVKLESREFKVICKVRKVLHTGDSDEGDWLSKCEATV